MGLRELIILLLGFVAIGVILQGLYVAIQARRNQIRVAIDNNIPEDFDIEDIELAELPSGGARKVPRHFEYRIENVATPRAVDENQNRTSNLSSEDSPVFMDVVEYGENFEDLDLRTEELDGDEREDVSGLETTLEVVNPVKGFFKEIDSGESFNSLDTEYTENQDGADDEDFDRFVETKYPGAHLKEDFDSVNLYKDDLDSNEKKPYGNDEENEISEDAYDAAFSGDDTRDFMRIGNTDDHIEDIDQDAGEGDISEAPYAKEYDEMFSDGYLDKPAEYESSGFKNDKMYQGDQSEKETTPVTDDGTASKSFFEDDLEEFSMTAGERIGYDQRLDGEVFNSGLEERGEDGSSESPPGESVKPSRIKTLLSFLKGEESIKSTEATFQTKDVLEEYEPREEVSEKAEIIEELEDFFDDQDSVDDLIANADEELEEVDQDSFTSAHLASDKVASFDGAVLSDIATREIRDNRLRNQNESNFSEVLIINVMSREDDQFLGDDLLKTLVNNGLVFGEMNIFHYYAAHSNEESVLFSAANILQPGTFDLYNMHEFSTIGISLFLSLPADVNNLEAFEHMIGVAKRICESLDGLLKDDHRNLMTGQTIEHYRQRIRDFELLQLKTAASRA
ncbi:MAG: cell division protein ZipA [Gammaproteobacteria bacterium]|nr:cell division protein ZipA [Gammaproteobacteria bacterium]